MTEGFDSLLAVPEQNRRDVFQAAAMRLDILLGYVEKDFWVCLVLDALFNRRPEGHPKTLFIEHPTLFPSSGVTYVALRVKIESGSRSALEPS